MSARPLDAATLPWTDATALARSLRPAALWSWLTDGGSLTQRLRARVGDGFALTVVGEAEEPLRAGDAQRMGVAAAQMARIREVRLDADGRCAIHAVTVIPAATLVRAPRLATLGSRPLGDALFDPELVGTRAVREPFEVALLAPDHALAARALEAAGVARAPVWARRSVVRLDGAPLLIHECFVAGWDW